MLLKTLHDGEYMLVRLEGLSKAYGPKKILQDVTFQINRRDRLALIGGNGAGKTTLIRLIMGEERPDMGEVMVSSTRIGYMPQFPRFKKGETVRETITVFPYFSEDSSKRRQELERLMNSDPEAQGIDWNDLAKEYAALETRVENETGKSLLPDMDMLHNLGLESMLEKRVENLSGGEATKVMLAKVLNHSHDLDLLILDEPTSHLEIESVEWLEDYLLRLRCAQLLVSHDRYFLDDVVTHVLELDDGSLISYSGNYSEFAYKKQLDMERQWKLAEKNRVERERQERVVEEMHRQNWFGSAHRTRMKMLDRIDELVPPKAEETFSLDIGLTGKSGKNMIIAKDLEVRRDGKHVLKGLDLSLMREDKLGIFGPNGSGKTTLLQTLLLELPYNKGELWVAPGARIGYYAQGHNGLDNTISAERLLLKVLGEEKRLIARRLLARFRLTHKSVERPIGSLSGGERARVALAMLIAEKHNLLILDEPSNYLDILSRQTVEAALSEYGGTMIIVTHDRYLMDAVCNKVARMRDGRLDVFQGNYSDLKGRPKRPMLIQEAHLYRVIGGFTEWKSRKGFKPGDKIAIADAELENYRWALENGKLRRIPGKEMKKVEQP